MASQNPEAWTGWAALPVAMWTLTSTVLGGFFHFATVLRVSVLTFCWHETACCPWKLPKRKHSLQNAHTLYKTDIQRKYMYSMKRSFISVWKASVFYIWEAGCAGLNVYFRTNWYNQRWGGVVSNDLRTFCTLDRQRTPRRVGLACQESGHCFTSWWDEIPSSVFPQSNQSHKLCNYTAAAQRLHNNYTITAQLL